MKVWRANNREKVTAMRKRAWSKFGKMPKVQVKDIKSKVLRKGKYEWRLSEEEALWFITQPCYYCGSKAEDQPFKRNGMDRFDNAPAYDLDTVVPCCWQCNQAKHKMTMDEFFEWFAKLKAFQERRQTLSAEITPAPADDVTQ